MFWLSDKVQMLKLDFFRVIAMRLAASNASDFSSILLSVSITYFLRYITDSFNVIDNCIVILFAMLFITWPWVDSLLWLCRKNFFFIILFFILSAIVNGGMFSILPAFYDSKPLIFLVLEIICQYPYTLRCAVCYTFLPMIL